MKYKFQYFNEEEKEQLLQQNKSLTLIEEQVLFDGKYLVFSDNPSQDRPVIYTNVPKYELEVIKQVLDEIVLTGGDI